METMYGGIPFSPQTTLSDTIGAGDTVIPVADISAFPDAPNYATIGTDADGETILYSAKTSTSLSGCTRGVEGTAKSWPSGSVIGRNFTAKDLAAIQKNVSDHDTELGKKYSATNTPPYPVTKVNGQTGAVSVLEPTDYAGTFLSTGWVADTVYAYKQTISISGLLASYAVRPDVDVVQALTDKDADAEVLAGFSLIQVFVTGADSLTAYCMEEAPTVNVPVTVRVFE